MIKERRDNKGRILLTGESQLKNGSYTFRYTDKNGKRVSFTNWRLLPGDEAPDFETNPECLRDTEERIRANMRRYHRVRPARDTMTLNDYWEKYLSMKCEISENTLVSYIYLYNRHIRNDFGKRPVDTIRYADVKRFYIRLISYGLNISSISNVHNIIHPVLDLAVKEGDIEKNPSDNVLSEMRRRKDWGVEHREALTADQQAALVKYASESYQYRFELFPMLTVFLGTGMRLGELTALTWNDIDFANNVILVRKTLNNKTTLSGKYGFYITFPKSRGGVRDIPMLDDVRKTLEEMYERRYDFNSLDQIEIDGFTDFVFRDLNGKVYDGHRINNMLRRVREDYNREETRLAEKEGRDPFLLPKFTAHNLRHSFCSRIIESGMNIKSVQLIMGHAHAETTLRIYAQVTESRNKDEMKKMNGKFRIR